MAGLLGPMTGAAFANTITVANDHDSGPGSLRTAIVNASSGDTIVVPTAVGEIQLTAELVVGKSITIQASGSGRPQINGTPTTRVLYIDGGATVTITGVLISGGHAVAPGGDALGGGILIHGASLTLSNSVVTQNVADVTGGGSGGIAEGGGIAADTATSSLTLLDSTVSDDRMLGQGGSDAWGGGLFDAGSLVIRGGSVEGNTSNISTGGSIAGGGIYYSASGAATATIENASIFQNAAQVGIGQGVDAFGGGLFAAGGAKMTLSNVTVANNFLNVNGGQGNDSGGIAEGAGLYISGVQQATVVNATVTGNSATANGSGTGQGGGVYGAGLAGPNGELSVTNSTIAGNGGTATGPAGSVNGGNVWTTNGNIFFENSIVAAGFATPTTPGAANCSGGADIVSHGHNIDSLDQCGFHGAGDKVGRIQR